MLSILPLLAALTPAAPLALQEGTPPNIVMILADDFGVDMVAAYGESPVPPCTPNIDGLAATGMLFRNAWANPVCSPTRAALLTGRHGFRTGVGQVVLNDGGLPLDELIIPEMLSGYTSAAVGKWHLAGNQGPTHPNESGFDRFAGTLGGGVGDYSQWMKNVNGQTSVTTVYATTDTANEAIASMTTMPEPWFLYVSFIAPHSPYHQAPASLCPASGCPPFKCSTPSANPTNAQLAKGMIAAMDTELGRLLATLDSVDPSAYVFFMGDNGTAGQASIPPFSSMKAKDTLYEGGVNVPLIVRCPGVVNAECQGLVSCTDLFATFAELAGVPSQAEDSVSIAPYFADPGASLRSTVYTESFLPNGSAFPPPGHHLAIRQERYKLKRGPGEADELFDLLNDPFETTNLLPTLSAAEQAAYQELEAELLALHTGDALAVFPGEVSVSGGDQALALSAGAGKAGGIHVLVGSMSGTAPGVSVGGLLLPLNADAYTQLTLVLANGSVFEGTVGVLDAQGEANAAIHIAAPLNPSLVGATLDHAFVVIGAGGAVELASNAASLTLGI